MATRLKKVSKGLSPEEKTLIDNLKAMISELESMEAGKIEGDDGVADALKAVENMAGTAPNEELGGVESPDIEAAQRKKELMGEDMLATKAVSTDTDVPPANADAEDRIEEIPEVDEDNIGEVAKALKVLLARRSVGKSENAVGRSEAVDPIVMVAKAMQAMGDRMSVYETSMTNLLQGMGIVDQVAAQAKVEKDERLPVASGDHDQAIDMVAKALLEAVGRNGPQSATLSDDKGMEEVRKDMTGVLSTMGQSALWDAGQPAQSVGPIK